MAEAAVPDVVEYPCRFEWKIDEYFLQRNGTHEAVFYNGSPTLTKWKVTLQCIGRAFNRWKFSFRLKCLESGCFLVEVKRLMVTIDGTHETIEKKEESNYSFDAEKDYEFETWVCIEETYSGWRHESRWNDDRLKIVIEMSFPSQNIANPEINEFAVYHLRKLSQDLGKLLDAPDYSDLKCKPLKIFKGFLYTLDTSSESHEETSAESHEETSAESRDEEAAESRDEEAVESRDEEEAYPVHSFMMHARWTNFFTEHPKDMIPNDTVLIDVSSDTLKEILIYMYSGRLSQFYDHPLVQDQKTEIIDVFDRYQLYHFYKSFGVDHSVQKRKTLVPGFRETSKFHLDDPADGPPKKNPTYIWEIKIGGFYGGIVSFKINFHLTESSPPSVSYSVQSALRNRYFIRVCFEFLVEQVIENRTDYIGSDLMHDKDHTLNPNTTVEMGKIALPETINLQQYIEKWDLEDRDETIRHSFPCFVYFNCSRYPDVKITNLFHNGIASDAERFGVLSDHMSKLLTQRTYSDLQVKCPDNSETYSLHKAIFAARVPNWKGVFENVAEVDAIPGDVTCKMRSEAFRHVLQYIYTGKMSLKDNPFIDEIKDFAVKGKFSYLETLVSRKRTRSVSKNSA